MTYRDIIHQNRFHHSSVNWWPLYAYHFTDIQNAVSILKEEYLYSRYDAKRFNIMRNDNIDVKFYEEEFKSAAKLKCPTLDVVAENCCKKAKYIYDTRKEMLDKIEKSEESYLFNSIEMPLVYVLADMELTGIKVDVNYLKEMGNEIEKQIKKLSKEIYELARCEFNILSPKQLSDVLFVKLRIPYPKKIKDNNYSTSKDILDKIVNLHPIVNKIEEYRILAKLYNNYVAGLIDEVASDGRIHTIFNQTLTRTGRLSSSSPNLQNIPIRLEYGKLIRKAFLPDKDSIILSSDYSQIELRVFAHISKADNLIKAFIENQDIHAKTASDIFGVPIEMVDSNMRRQAKAVNFGILYGISSFGLSEDLNIDVSYAKEFIDNYLKTYPRISEYMKEVIKEAHLKGYVTTLMNRKRTIDELKNKNYMIRSSGERMALNTPIQGTSADILKKAIELDSSNFAAYYALSLSYLKLDLREEAYGVLKRTLELNPNHTVSMFNLGQLYLKDSRFDEAIECYKNAIAHDAKLTHMYFNIANAYHLKGDAHKAIKYWEKTVEYDDKNTGALLNLANAYSSLGESAIAIRKARSAYILDKKNPDVIMAYAIILLKESDIYGAREKFEEVLEINPDLTVAKSTSELSTPTIVFPSPKLFHSPPRYSPGFRLFVDIYILPTGYIAFAN